MFIALEKNSKERISANVADENKEYLCPVCGEKVILKGGPYVTQHFAHLPNSLCSAEDLENSMSEWHCEWQNRFPEENQEICFAMDISDFDFYKKAEIFNMEHKFNTQYNEAIWHNETIENTKTRTIEHRADIVFNNYVIEFQHSPMFQKEFNERTWFYTRFGYRMIWVFDVRDEVNSYNMRKNGISGSDGYKKFKWKWDRPFTTFADLDIASEGWHKNEDGKWSRGNVVLLFQTKDFDKNALFPPFLENVCWAPWTESKSHREYYDYRNFLTRIKTSFKTYEAFFEALKSGQL